jgi:hypothetical protein
MALWKTHFNQCFNCQYLGGHARDESGMLHLGLGGGGGARFYNFEFGGAIL